jgi:4-amino-4-deoxy-L-arabinose transferase-like glycosyltransferase
LKKALPLAVFVVSAVWLSITANLSGDFRIDEAHKISETWYLRLIERGDFHHPDWLSSPIERANPPAGKVIFGLAMQAAGVELPRDGTFAMHPDPRGKPAELRSALRPTRMVSVLATAGTAALACLLAGPIASLLFLGSFVTRTYADAAVYDALLTFFVVAAAVSIARKVTWPRTVAAATLAALAFDTRASGIIALLGIIVLIRDWRKALAAIAICFVVATALNPVCWVPAVHLRDRSIVTSCNSTICARSSIRPASTN